MSVCLSVVQSFDTTVLKTISIYNLIFYFLVVQQSFEIRVIDEFILLGNSAIMKCLLPSFVTDFVQVVSWLILDDDESTEISISQENLGKMRNIFG